MNTKVYKEQDYYTDEGPGGTPNDLRFPMINKGPGQEENADDLYTNETAETVLVVGRSGDSE